MSEGAFGTLDCVSAFCRFIEVGCFFSSPLGNTKLSSFACLCLCFPSHKMQPFKVFSPWLKWEGLYFKYEFDLYSYLLAFLLSSSTFCFHFLSSSSNPYCFSSTYSILSWFWLRQLEFSLLVSIIFSWLLAFFTSINVDMSFSSSLCEVKDSFSWFLLCFSRRMLGLSRS